MTRKLSVYVESANAFRPIKLNAKGEPVYVSNGAQIGTGIRTIEVTDEPDPPPPDPAPSPDPLPFIASDVELAVMPNGTIDAVNARLIPYPFPQAGVYPRMYDMVIGGQTYVFDAETESGFVLTSGIYTVTFGYWGFVQAQYDAADAGSLPANGVTSTIMTVTSYRISDEAGAIISAAKGPLSIKITGDSGTIDNTSPTVLSVSPSGTDVSVSSSVILSCSEAVQAGSGDFTVYDVTNATVHETIAAGSATYSGTQITLSPTIPWANSTQYAVRWAGGTFTDTSPQANGVAANTGNTHAWTTEAASSGALWYDTVFARRGGTGVGPRVSSFTGAAAWAAATTGVSNSGTVITVSGNGITAAGIDFSGFKLVNSGSGNIFEDCIGDVNTNGQGGNGRQWSIGGANPTVRYCRITNPNFLGGVNEISFHDATGTVTEHHNDFRDWAGQDPWKGPTNTATVVDSHDSLFKGCHLTSGAHIDTIDIRRSAPGSKWSRHIVIGDKTATSVASGTGTGFNNAVRYNPGDFGGAEADGLTVEECILVGHDDTGASATFLDIGNSGATNIVLYDLIVDLRQHNQLVMSDQRCSDWYVRTFDYAASVAAGKVSGLSSPVAYPNLATYPAAVPDTMSAPVITAVSGGFSYAAMTRPANQRSLITGYTIQYSTDGTSWTSTAASLDGGTVSVGSVSNLRARVFATNGVGNGTASASSNILPVISGGTITVNDFAIDGQVFDVGATVGGTSASVYGSGTASAGAVIEAKPSGLGTWQTIATADGSGVWAGTIPVTEDGVLHYLDVRLAASTGVTAQTTNRFTTGHVGTQIGQSNNARLHETYYDQITHPTVTDTTNLIVRRIDHGQATPTTALIRVDNSSSSSSATKATAAEKYMSNILAELAPGKKFMFYQGSLPTYGPQAMVNDADTNRYWAGMQEIFGYSRNTLHTEVSWIGVHWYAAVASSWKNNWLPNWAPIFFQQLSSGTAVTLGTTAATPNPYTLDHSLMSFNGSGSSDLSTGAFYRNKTRLQWMPPKNRPPDAAISSPLQGSPWFTGQFFDTIRNTGIPGFMADSRAIEVFDTVGVGAHNLLGDGSSHAAADDADGHALFARYIALNWLMSAGIVTETVPSFTSFTWDSSGTFMDANIDLTAGGTLTTIRTKRSEALSSQTSYPSGTTVVGGWLNGTEALKGVVQTSTGASAKVRFTRASGNFANGNTFKFGPGSSPCLSQTDNTTHKLHKDVPIVDHGWSTLEGIPLAWGQSSTASGIA